MWTHRPGIPIGSRSPRKRGPYCTPINSLDDRGAVVLRQKWSRGQVEARLANMPPCLIGMEACVGAHHLSRNRAFQKNIGRASMREERARAIALLATSISMRSRES